MLVNFDLNDLYAFRALVKYGNFRQAGEAVCLSQSAFSRRIDRLERALGIKLFERTTRRVNLTLPGRIFAERAELLLVHFEEMMVGIDELNHSRRGLVSVACVPSAAYYFMPAVMADFRAKYPRVRIKLIDSSAGEVYNAVINGDADFGISFSGAPQPAVNFMPLLEDAYVAACRHDHPLAGKKSVCWTEFYQHDWIKLDKSSGNRNILDKALVQITPARPAICETQHVATQLGMVEAGVGIAAVPAMSILTVGHHAITGVPLIEPTVKREMGLLRRSGCLLPPLASELENMLIARYQPR